MFSEYIGGIQTFACNCFLIFTHTRTTYFCALRVCIHCLFSGTIVFINTTSIIHVLVQLQQTETCLPCFFYFCGFPAEIIKIKTKPPTTDIVYVYLQPNIKVKPDAELSEIPKNLKQIITYMLCLLRPTFQILGHFPENADGLQLKQTLMKLISDSGISMPDQWRTVLLLTNITLYFHLW